MLLALPLAFAADYPQDQAAVPPMGWNSWNCYGTTVTADGVLAQAQAIVDAGLREKGFVYLVIDDGWQGDRDATTGALQGNAAFPDVGALSDQVRALGLRLGIYSTPWPTSYGGYPGGEGHEQADAWQYAAWHIRYLKYDWHPIDLSSALRMRDALSFTGAPIVYSLSNTATRWLAPDYAGAANLWRTTTDITDTWESLQDIGFQQSSWADVSGPGHWNDPDMMVLGWVGWGAEQHLTRLTADEQKTHVTLWALLAAPMILGADLTRLDADTLALLTDDDVLEIDQDPLGVQASAAWSSGTSEVWTRPLQNGDRAVGAFNRGDTEVTFTVPLDVLGPGPATDVWDGSAQTVGADGLSVTVPAHGARLFRVGGNAPIGPAFVGPLRETTLAGAPFGYTFLTTGARPVTVTPTGMPDGLSFDGATLTGTPTTPGTYTVEVTAENSGGTVSDTFTLEVRAAASTLHSFGADTRVLPPGQTGTLSWVAEDAVQIDGLGSQPAVGSTSITPDATTTYTLTTGTDSATVTVEVPTGAVEVGLYAPGRLHPLNDATEWQGWGTATEDMGLDGGELSVGGVQTPHGLLTHADSTLVYTLDGRYTWLSAQVGIDDEKASATASATFTVTGDGVELWTSGELGAGDAPVPVDVDVSGVDELVLTVSGGDTIDDDHAAWLAPQVWTATATPGDTGGTDTGDGDDSGPVDTADSAPADTDGAGGDDDDTAKGPWDEAPRGCGGCATATTGGDAALVLLAAWSLRRRRA